MPKYRMPMKPRRDRCRRKRRRNSSALTAIFRFLLPWAQSFHRKVTRSFSKSSSGGWGRRPGACSAQVNAARVPARQREA
jgi:hypothetical protein